MSAADIAILVVGGCLTALFGTVAYLLKCRFDTQDKTLEGIGSKVTLIDREVTRLTEAQKSVVANQAAHSRIAERMLDESDDLQDKVEDLDRMTSRLYDRLGEHDKYLQVLRGGDVG